MHWSRRRIVALPLLALAAGCGTAASPNEAPPKNQGSKTSEDSKTAITDLSNRTVTFDKPVTRIVNTWPSSTAMMICLGQGNKLVGTHPYPTTIMLNAAIFPDIDKVPKVKDNVEEMAKLNPEAVVTVGPTEIPALEKAGLTAVDLYFRDYPTLKQSASALGAMLGGEGQRRADDLVRYIDEVAAEVKSLMKDLPEEDKPLVYYASGGLYSSTGRNTIMADWTAQAGGRYATADMKDGMGLKVDKEAILRMNPDVIIVSGGSQEDRSVAQQFRTAPEWADIKAVRNNRIHIAPVGCFSWERFGAESAMAPLWAASVLHPERVKVDIRDRARQFYRRFAGYEITDAQLEKALAGDSQRTDR